MPHLSKHHQGWNHWYHLTFTAYGQWLRGDPRGWRERHHRLHVGGDYKNPPQPTNYQRAIHAQSQRLLKHDPAYFLPEDRAFIGEILLETFTFQKLAIAAIGVSGEHIHALLQCADDDPERASSRTKQFVWTEFHKRSNAPRPWPRLWAKRPYGKPISDEKHFREARGYIRKHLEEGAWTWCEERGAIQLGWSPDL